MKSLVFGSLHMQESLAPLLSSGQAIRSSGGNLRRYQDSQKIPFLLQVLDLPQGLPPLGHFYNKLVKNMANRHPNQMIKLPQMAE